jgi:hypothetical protein
VWCYCAHLNVLSDLSLSLLSSPCLAPCHIHLHGAFWHRADGDG